MSIGILEALRSNSTRFCLAKSPPSWQPKEQPLIVKLHDFMDPESSRAIPYGVYDLSRNEGWVSVGIDHDTAQLAAQAIHRWWKKMGAKQLLITADGGGSNGSRSRL